MLRGFLAGSEVFGRLYKYVVSIHAGRGGGGAWGRQPLNPDS